MLERIHALICHAMYIIINVIANNHAYPSFLSFLEGKSFLFLICAEGVDRRKII